MQGDVVLLMAKFFTEVTANNFILVPNNRYLDHLTRAHNFHRHHSRLRHFHRHQFLVVT